MPKLPGLNIQSPWATLLLSGEKTIETRGYPLPARYIEQDLWLIETPGKDGRFRARVIGIIRFSGSKKYGSAEEFYADFDLHRISTAEAIYKWKPGVAKYGWFVAQVQQTQPFEAPTPRGIVYCGPFQAN